MEDLSWPVVDLVDYNFQLSVSNGIEVCIARQVSPQDAVDMLVAAPLPGRVGLGEVAPSVDGGGHPPMVGKLQPVVKSDGSAGPRRQRAESTVDQAGPFPGLVGLGSQDYQETALPLHLGGQALGVAIIGHAVAFPVAELAAIRYQLWSAGDVHPVGYDPFSVLPAVPIVPDAVGPGQVLPQVKLPALQAVDELIDALLGKEPLFLPTQFSGYRVRGPADLNTGKDMGFHAGEPIQVVFLTAQGFAPVGLPLGRVRQVLVKDLERSGASSALAPG